MGGSIFRLVLIITALVVFASQAMAGELRAPRVGMRMTWKCSGPYSKLYDLRVIRINNGIVRYEGQLDGKFYFVDKPASLTGTSLWVRLFGRRRQWFDRADFAGYKALRPGTRFKGPVPARKGADKWVWDYSVSVGQAQTVNHRLLGTIKLVPVSEKRRVFHGKYWSKMTTYLLPEKGLSVKWVYVDPKGKEQCDLIRLK